jgi:RecJ-like exonuclease
MEEFLESCKEARKLAYSFKEPLVVHHYDADGISSGAIVAGALQKESKTFRRECIKKLDDTAIERYAKEKELIFVDLGGGNKRVNELSDVLIIDHHQTEGIEKPQANPLLHGIGGSDELSAAGTAYCVFREFPDLAVVGSVGDMQLPLRGMNRWVLEQGVEAGLVKVEEDLTFYGRYCRPLVQFLAYSDSPYVPGISYREDRAEKLLAELGILLEQDGQRRVYADLRDDEKRALISALAKLLINANMLKKTNELIGESYIFPKRPSNETFEANEFSTLLNACGRHGQPDVGIKVCLGDESAYEEASNLLRLHRRMLREGISYASGHVQDFGRFRFVDGRKKIGENIIGTVCGMALNQRWKTPIIGISLGEEGSIKVSSRAPRSLVEDGLNLGGLMKEATEQLGGIGGGHKIAAGASLPPGKLNEFLLFAGNYLGTAEVVEE